MLCCRGDQFSYMIHGEDTPDPGPELPTRYQPGQPGQHGSTVAGDCQDVTIISVSLNPIILPGAAWTAAELEATRARILQAIHPDWAVQKQMFGSDLAQHYGRTAVTENRIMRLVFHDCVKYTGPRWRVFS